MTATATSRGGNGDGHEPAAAPRNECNVLQLGRWSAMPTLVRDSGAVKELTLAAGRCFVVLVAGASWRDGGVITVSQTTLAEKVGLSERSVGPALALLEKLGLIRRLHQGVGKLGDASTYQIVVGPVNPKQASVTDSFANRKAASGTGVNRNQDSDTGRNVSEGVPEDARTGAGSSASKYRKLASDHSEYSSEYSSETQSNLPPGGSSPRRQTAAPGAPPCPIEEVTDETIDDLAAILGVRINMESALDEARQAIACAGLQAVRREVEAQATQLKDRCGAWGAWRRALADARAGARGNR